MNKLTLTLLTSLTLLNPWLHAVSVSTAPVGFINLTIRGTDNGGLTAISVPMLPQVVYSGVIETASGTVITDASSTWSDNDYATPDDNGNASHYAEITSHTDTTQIGTILEIMGSSGTGKSLTVATPVDGLAGASYAIRAFRTLGSVFGTDNSAGLTAAVSLSGADVIYKIGVDNGIVGWQRYYYKSGGIGGTGWRRDTSTSKSMANVAISPDEGLLIFRRSATDVTVTIPGSIKTNDSRTALVNGFNLVSSSYPVDTTLGELGLESKLAQGVSDSAADIIYIVTNTGGFERFYYKSGGIGGTGWRMSGNTSADQSSKQVTAGSAVVIYRRSATGVDWKTTKPF